MSNFLKQTHETEKRMREIISRLRDEGYEFYQDEMVNEDYLDKINKLWNDMHDKAWSGQ